MRVRELIDELRKENQDMVVFLSGDSEGNSFFPLEAIGTAEYRDIGIKMDAIRVGERAVVLWPESAPIPS